MNNSSSIPHNSASINLNPMAGRIVSAKRPSTISKNQAHLSVSLDSTGIHCDNSLLKISVSDNENPNYFHRKAN